MRYIEPVRVKVLMMMFYATGTLGMIIGIVVAPPVFGSITSQLSQTLSFNQSSGKAVLKCKRLEPNKVLGSQKPNSLTSSQPKLHAALLSYKNARLTYGLAEAK